MKVMTTAAGTFAIRLAEEDFPVILNCLTDAKGGMASTKLAAFQPEISRLLQATSSLKAETAPHTLVLTRDEAILLKNVLFEAYIEMGEFEFHRRIKALPEYAVHMLKALNRSLKQSQ